LHLSFSTIHCYFCSKSCCKISEHPLMNMCRFILFAYQLKINMFYSTRLSLYYFDLHLKPNLNSLSVFTVYSADNATLKCVRPRYHIRNTASELLLAFVFQLRNLFEMGYSLMSIDKDGQTALHVASQRGDSNLVRYILANAPSNIVSVKDNQE